MAFVVRVEPDRRLLSFGGAQTVMDGILDSLPADARQEDIDAAVLSVARAMIRGPKRADTVRRRLVSIFPMIAPLAERDPEAFDEVLIEALERVGFHVLR